jgi:hypothetical protein
MKRRGRDKAGGADDEAARYRRAAQEALNQVDWCIAYLRRIQKRQLAARLEKNRDDIARSVRRVR